MQGATAVERLTIYVLIGWFVRMLREESEISAWHGLMWLRLMILLIMVGYLKCSPHTEDESAQSACYTVVCQRYVRKV